MKEINLVNRIALATMLSFGVIVSRDLVMNSLHKPVHNIQRFLTNEMRGPPQYPKPSFIPEYEVVAEKNRILEELDVSCETLESIHLHNGFSEIILKNE